MHLQLDLHSLHYLLHLQMGLGSEGCWHGSPAFQRFQVLDNQDSLESSH